MQKKPRHLMVYGINGIYGILWCHIYGIYMGLGPRNEDLHQLDEKLTLGAGVCVDSNTFRGQKFFGEAITKHNHVSILVGGAISPS